MSFSDCPFCHQIVSPSELERHADNHFVEEELARDVELAQQIADAPISPCRVSDSEIGDGEWLETGVASECSTSAVGELESVEQEMLIIEKIACLIRLQIRGPFHRVEGGLLVLLRRCLEMETNNSISILSDSVDHYQSVEVEDFGWGCGWRNIQMLSSHLLLQRPEAKEVLFGGSGFVPDIPSLQRWLEIAWQRGFDVCGAYSFGQKIYGSTKWIGTAECATLFRSFGLRARIVDFGSKEINSIFSSVYAGNPCAQTVRTHGSNKRKVEQVYGPMDKFLHRRNFGFSKADSFSKGSSISVDGGIDLYSFSQGYNKSYKGQNVQKKCDTRETGVHQDLAEWVWNYFNDRKFHRCGDIQHVVVSEKMPLYFQHDGHSRTIVGIQVKQGHLQMPRQYTLLVLDPAHRTEALERSLKENVGWQKLIKRGVHTLKKPRYQLCYVDIGLARWKEIEQLKTIDSFFFDS